MEKWSELPQDLLFLISDRLRICDLLRFGAVCRLWQSAVDERRRLCLSSRRESPWLCFNEAAGEEPRFYSLSDQRFYSKPMPEVRCIGSGYGWLVVVYETCYLALLNPITGQQFLLPHFSTFFDSLFAIRRKKTYRGGRVVYKEGDCTKEFGACRFITKAILTSPPGRDDEGDCIVFVMGYMCRIAYARPGDKTWTVASGHLDNLDVICHQGQIYTALSGGGIASWDFTNSSTKLRRLKPTIVVESRIESDDDMADYLMAMSSPRLVSSPSGDLLCVLRTSICLWIEVHKVNFEKRELVKVTSLGDHAIFMLLNSSMCLSVIDLPHLQRDCIYFEDPEFGESIPRISGSRTRNGSRPPIGEIFMRDYKTTNWTTEFLPVDDLSCQRYRTTCFLPSLA